MQPDRKTEELILTHPCFCEDAHKKFARIHLPVAPVCNIQCNYCNRKYDCCNESRPGVTSGVLTAVEAADRIREVKKKIPELSVIAIAGPGDPLANESTFNTIALVKDEFPEMSLCISTNGLMLPDSVDRLYDLGVRFVTVTMNGVDPDITEDIYSFVRYNGKNYTGREAAEILLENQLKGIKACVEKGMVVKINTVMIPGINTEHIPSVVKKVKELGVYIVNILPLIPVEGTPFSSLRAPTPEERKSLMDICSADVRMMRHCRQCRADAVGLLDNDRSSEFIRKNPCGSACGPGGDNVIISPVGITKKVAVATKTGEKVDRGFGNAEQFIIYDRNGVIDTVKISTGSSTFGQSHVEHINDIVSKLKDCDTVIVREIGPAPRSLLESEGKKIIISNGLIKDELSGLFL